MAAYVIVDLTPKNQEKLAIYSASAASTFEPYGGKIIAKGPVQVLHGERSFDAKAVIEFPNAKKAAEWYNSADYQALIATRDQGMDSQFHLVG